MKKDIFYFLKKIAKHGNVLKEDFLQQIYITDKFGLRIGKNNKDRKLQKYSYFW